MLPHVRELERGLTSDNQVAFINSFKDHFNDFLFIWNNHISKISLFVKSRKNDFKIDLRYDIFFLIGHYENLVL